MKAKLKAADERVKNRAASQVVIVFGALGVALACGQGAPQAPAAGSTATGSGTESGAPDASSSTPASDAGSTAATGNPGSTAATGNPGSTAATGSPGSTSATGDPGSAAATGDSGPGQSEGATTDAPPDDEETPTVPYKPRVIHTTDLGADVDDRQSMVRQLVMANDFDIEGLVVATGCWRKTQSGTTMLDDLVDVYGEVVANLKVHDPEYPSVEELRSISVMGQPGYGMGDVGEGRDSEGSEMIIGSVDRDDPRPLWATCWGGCNTIAQALWKVQNTRSADELARFVSKLHVYDVLGQDNAGTWIAKNFPELIYIRATSLYDWQPVADGPTGGNRDQAQSQWVRDNIQSHGPLGGAYPDRDWVYEGDTPAFLHLVPNGLNDPARVDQGGWGGRFQPATGIRGMSCMSGEDDEFDPYVMYNEPSESISRWKTAIENDFAARMDWSITNNYADANHHPVAVLNGDTTRQVLEFSASAGSALALNADDSSDPDGDALIHSWSFDSAPSSYGGSVMIQGGDSSSATVAIPGDAGGTNIHIILELRDDGSPNLYMYRRAIINVQ